MDACVAILKVAVSPATISFTAFTIIAREGLEAIVILAALLAGMRGDEQQGTRRWVSAGAWLAIAASGLTFWLSKTLIQSLARYGEKLEAVISILAVIILLMVTNWVFHKFYWVGWNAKLRSLSKASQKTVTDRWEWLALLGVGFLTVYREGFETTLFMQSLLLEGSVWPVVIGVLLGTGFIAAIGVGIFVYGAKLPYRKLLVVTGVLVVSIMVTFFGSTARLFPDGGLDADSFDQRPDRADLDGDVAGIVSLVGGGAGPDAGARVRWRRVVLGETHFPARGRRRRGENPGTRPRLRVGPRRRYFLFARCHLSWPLDNPSKGCVRSYAITSILGARRRRRERITTP